MKTLIVLLAAMTAAQAAEHKLKATPENIVWGHYSAAVKPVLRVQSGDTVEMQTLVTNSPKRLIASGVKPEDIEPELIAVHEKVTDRGPSSHLLTGPVYVEGAAPGDVLEVRILKIRPSIPYSYNSFGPRSGLLQEDFPKTESKIVPLDLKRNVGRFSARIEIPLRPFFGSMGVAPPESAGRISSAPPGIHAGNLDNKELVEGTTLYIPVHVPGALFVAGDGHAAQGNGEVDVTALETSLTGVFQLVVRKDMRLRWPRAETPTHHIVMGLHEDLTEAAKLAVREAIDFLVTAKGLSRDEAYMLCSSAVDFEITQVVDGTKGVHGMIPRAFSAERIAS